MKHHEFIEATGERITTLIALLCHSMSMVCWAMARQATTMGPSDPFPKHSIATGSKKTMAVNVIGPCYADQEDCNAHDFGIVNHLDLPKPFVASLSAHVGSFSDNDAFGGWVFPIASVSPR